jgi:hypothetical protein
VSGVVVADSVTELAPATRGAVLVAGSHAGVIAATLAARGGARAVILNDAGVGKDAAGIAGLALLESIGMAGAAVAHTSARIGDGTDVLERGVISHANAPAAACGIVAGMSCREAARRLTRAPAPHGALAGYPEGRFLLSARSGECEIWALDSVGKIEAADAGRVLLIGSHCALHGGRAESALPVRARAAVFHDAGVGAAGLTRLPVLAAHGIAAAAVDGMSARIGDGRSMWETGVLAHFNGVAIGLGARVGMRAEVFARQAAGRS